jgi:hypothetical protein
MSRMLTDMADVLRRAGCHVVEMENWKERSRLSSRQEYADDRPWCIMWHHTASNGSGEADARYCTHVSPIAPVVNIVIGRSAVVYVCAAGPTNTNGKGNALAFSKGTVPKDSMNTFALAIEISNDGIGMQYPQVQIDCCFIVSNALTAAYGLETDDVAGHADYSPGRKIDPATADAVQGPWRPRSTNKSGTWSLADLRAECARRGTPLPPTEPTDPTTPITNEEIDMLGLDLGTPGKDSWWTRMTYTGDTLCHVVSPADQLQARGKVPIVPIEEKELSALLDTVMTVGNSPFKADGQAPNAALHGKWEAARGRT